MSSQLGNHNARLATTAPAAHVWRVPLTNLSQTFEGLDKAPPALFYPAQEFAAHPPMMELAPSATSHLALLLYGRSGTNYVLQANTNLARTNGWVTTTNFILTNSFRYLELATPPNQTLFYRSQRP